jgi:hypothetical protein
MRIRIRIPYEYGWHTFETQLPEGADEECYAQPQKVCRVEWWEKRLNIKLPHGRGGMVWHLVPDYA